MSNTSRPASNLPRVRHLSPVARRLQLRDVCHDELIRLAHLAAEADHDDDDKTEAIPFQPMLALVTGGAR